MRDGLRSLLIRGLNRIDAGKSTKMPILAADVPIDARDQDMSDLSVLERSGLIRIIRDSRDIVAGRPGKIEIIKPVELGEVLAHKPYSRRLADAEIMLREFSSGRNDFLVQAADLVLDCWRARKTAFGLKVEESGRLGLMFRFLNAIARGDQQGKDVRQFSTALGLGSKDFESVSGPLFKLLRELFALSNDEDVLEAIGLVRYGQPILLSGPALFDGVRLPADPFIGIAPENASRIAAGAGARYLLTIENLASFHRYIRAIQDGGLVVFTGGFPRPAVLAAIVRIAGNECLPIYHWGDIDAGGVTIFRTIELALGGRLQPHLMTPALAERDGHPIKTDRRLVTISESDSAIAPLAGWLMLPEARKLEQEALAPVSPK